MAVPAFPLGGAVPQQELVGREALVDELAGWVAEGFRVLLTGPRRGGKSSVVAAVARRLGEAGTPHLYLDLAHCPTLRDAAEAVGRLCRGLAPPSAPLPNPAEANAPEQALAAALEMPDRVAELAGAEVCVLLLDGCEHLERLEALEALHRLRPALVRRERTGFLFAGVHSTGLARLAGTRAAPFALPIGLRPSEAEAWRGYLRVRFGTVLAEDGLSHLLERTGGHPFDLMAVCRAIRQRAHPLGPADVDAAVESVRPLLWPLLSAEAAALGAVRHGILHRLAHRRHIYREAGPPATIKRAMDSLVAAGVLHRGQRGSYAFTEPLLADCLRADA